MADKIDDQMLIALSKSPDPRDRLIFVLTTQMDKQEDRIRALEASGLSTTQMLLSTVQELDHLRRQLVDFVNMCTVHLDETVKLKERLTDVAASVESAGELSSRLEDKIGYVYSELKQNGIYPYEYG